jgi:hypothetical protein
VEAKPAVKPELEKPAEVKPKEAKPETKEVDKAGKPK